MRRSRSEYSKRMLSAMIALWFVGAVFGMAVCVVQLIISPMAVSVDSLLTYIGAPITGGIVSYLIKSALENREKIKRNEKDENYNG